MARLKKNFLPKSKKRLSAKSHLPSESMVYVGEERSEKMVVKIIDYDDNKLEELVVDDFKTCKTYSEKDSITWISVTGIHEASKVEEICNLFNIHPLVQEDILNTQQRTKI
jgi:magnesium transporter